jgi:Chromo (CHRromatin Organisation MOdifier) domain
MKELYSLLSIQGAPSTAWHPQTDGQTERANQEVEQYLRLFTNYCQDNWSDWIDIAEFTLNDRIHSAIKHSPFFLMYGFHPHNPSLARTLDISISPDALQYIIALKDIHNQAKLNLEKASHTMKKYYDAYRSEARVYDIGSKVWLEGTNITTLWPMKKFDDKRYGPFEVLAKVGPSSYRLKIPTTWHVHPVFNEILLTPFQSPSFPSQQRVHPRPPALIVGQEKEYKIEEIHNSRRHRRRLEFLVHWKGYPDEDNTWEPERHLENAPQVVKRFYDLHPRATR